MSSSVTAGVMLRSGESVHGLTTAALWVNAAIGLAAGIGSYAVAISSAVLTVAVLALFPVGYGGVAADGLGGYAAPGTRAWIRLSQYL